MNTETRRSHETGSTPRESGEALGLLVRRSLSRSVLSFGLCRAVLSRMSEIRPTPPPPHPPPPPPAHDASSVSDPARVGPTGGGGGRGVGGPRLERSWTAWAMDLCGIQIPRPLICMLVRTGTPSSTVRLLLRQPVHQMILVPEPKRNLCETSSSARKEVDGLSHRVAMFGVGWRQLPEGAARIPVRGF